MPDVRPADGNGIELCRDLLFGDTTGRLRCLMLTLFTDDEARHDAMLPTGCR